MFLLPGNITQDIVFTFKESWTMLLNVTIGQKQILQTTCFISKVVIAQKGILKSKFGKAGLKQYSK